MSNIKLTTEAPNETVLTLHVRIWLYLLFTSFDFMGFENKRGDSKRKKLSESSNYLQQ